MHASCTPQIDRYCTCISMLVTSTCLDFPTRRALRDGHWPLMRLLVHPLGKREGRVGKKKMMKVKKQEPTYLRYLRSQAMHGESSALILLIKWQLEFALHLNFTIRWPRRSIEKVFGSSAGGFRKNAYIILGIHLVFKLKMMVSSFAENSSLLTCNLLRMQSNDRDHLGC